MAEKNKLLYFDGRARAESVRIMHALADQPYIDERVTFEDWFRNKSVKNGKLSFYLMQVPCTSISKYM